MLVACFEFEGLVLQAKPDTVGKVCEIVRKQLALPLETDLTPEYFVARLSILPLIWSQHMGLEEFDISIEEDSSTNITTVQDGEAAVDGSGNPVNLDPIS
ncbi:hypothetical protein SAY86_022662 [Trapa natans]|uniref:Uncharacterized protein n=1 Tax=Trapa natans TaxID=22666 RepID=A0AAN7R773_TRANT|nr:hypothetical protein SAY86_022662 [Trapa natans]